MFIGKNIENSMSHFQPWSDGIHKLSRRDFIKASLIGTASAIALLYGFNEGDTDILDLSKIAERKGSKTPYNEYTDSSASFAKSLFYKKDLESMLDGKILAQLPPLKEGEYAGISWLTENQDGVARSRALVLYYLSSDTYYVVNEQDKRNIHIEDISKNPTITSQLAEGGGKIYDVSLLKNGNLHVWYKYNDKRDDFLVLDAADKYKTIRGIDNETPFLTVDRQLATISDQDLVLWEDRGERIAISLEGLDKGIVAKNAFYVREDELSIFTYDKIVGYFSNNKDKMSYVFKDGGSGQMNSFLIQMPRKEILAKIKSKNVLRQVSDQNKLMELGLNYNSSTLGAIYFDNDEVVTPWIEIQKNPMSGKVIIVEHV